MKDFLNKFPFQKVSSLITVISFTYNVLLDRDLDCTCKEDVTTNCNLYMILPFFTFFVLILWTDKVIPSCCTYWCTREKKRKLLCRVICIHIIKAAVVGGLWIVSVLMDGDWYVCCQNSKYPHLACKDINKFTEDEQATRANLRNKSRNIGFSTILAIVCLGFLMSLCNWRRCWGYYDRRVVYEELILKKSEDVLMEVLSESANEALKRGFRQTITERKFNECFDVVQNMIEETENSAGAAEGEQHPPPEDAITENASGNTGGEPQSPPGYANKTENAPGTVGLELQPRPGDANTTLLNSSGTESPV